MTMRDSKRWGEGPRKLSATEIPFIAWLPYICSGQQRRSAQDSLSFYHVSPSPGLTFSGLSNSVTACVTMDGPSITTKPTNVSLTTGPKGQENQSCIFQLEDLLKPFCNRFGAVRNT